MIETRTATARASLFTRATRDGRGAIRLLAAYLAVLLSAVAVERAFGDPLVDLIVFTAASAGGAAAVVAGVRLFRPPRTLPWYLLAAGQLAAAVNWVIWKGHLVLRGEVPAPGEPADWFWFANYLLLLAGLALLLRAREPRPGALSETMVVAIAAGLLAWVFIIDPYAHRESLPAAQRVVQIGFAFLDVVLAALIARLLVVAGRQPPSFVLLVAGALLLLGANLAWNWLLLVGDYEAGSWYETGWPLFSIAVGAAALHPSMGSLFVERPRARGALGRGGLALLLVAGLVGPAIWIFPTGPMDRDTELVLGVGTALILLIMVNKLRRVLDEEARVARTLADQNVRLRELDRLKDDFVAAVSHELRTPLTSIRGYVDLVREGEAGPLTEEQDRFFAVVDRNADRLLRVVGDLLFLSQVDADALALEMEEVDVAELAREAVEATSPVAEQHGLQLRLDVRGLPRLRGDRARLGQLLDNLLSNAVKFTPEGGRVDVSAFTENGRAVVEVADTGVGVPKEEQDRLFERFFRSANAGEQAIPGTGLGLPIAKAIADAHLGSISVESEEGRGTTFRVELPLERAGEDGVA